MFLDLYDTMAREKRRFVPRDPRRVTMYVCGPTVYNYAHIGNFRPVVVFDLLFRVLRRLYGDEHVLYAANVTDVDDKINRKAAEEGVPISVVTDRYLDAYNADAAALRALPPTFQPRATETIDAIIRMIGDLVRNGAAYAAQGHVLFNTRAFTDYGKLSGRPPEDLIAGARVDVAPYKSDPRDFVLWKPSKPGEPEWQSPWGSGRPGWHIECTAMIEEALGLPIDIHGGGIDLVFPHHENELAQGVCSGHGPEYARFWLHNGFLNMAEEKMSKSLGNVALARDLLGRCPGEVIRWALLVGHYRAPLEWKGGELLVPARKSLDRLYGALRRAMSVIPSTTEPSERFLAAIGNDLNTPEAFAELFALASELETGNAAVRARAKGELLASGRLIGFLEEAPEAWFQTDADAALKARIDNLVAERAKARDDKNWAAADRIRDELTALNVEVMDSARGGGHWRIKKV
jgi:cysteinyl-tRNA synthetase